jgi:hypothetical protein
LGLITGDEDDWNSHDLFGAILVKAEVILQVEECSLGWHIRNVSVSFFKVDFTQIFLFTNLFESAVWCIPEVSSCFNGTS